VSDDIAGKSGGAEQPIEDAFDDLSVTRLPHPEHAIAEVAKIRDYLLSRAHPVGRFKAAFFESLGYRAADWRRLERDLLDLCRSGVASEGQPSPFGSKYEVRGTLFGPSGRRAEVVTVWVILEGEIVPRFVTAYPG
jgi:hypothetical protein